MKNILFAVLVVLGVVSTVSAQYGPGYSYNPYYQQPQAPRYYNGNYPSSPTPYYYYPQPPNGVYYPAAGSGAAPYYYPAAPTYYPRGTYYPPATSSAAPSVTYALPTTPPAVVTSAPPAVVTSAPPEVVTIAPATVGANAKPASGAQSTPEVVIQIPEAPGLPTTARAPRDNRTNLSIMWEKLHSLNPEGSGASFHRTPKELFWVSGEYVAAFFRPMRLDSPLVTIGSVADPRQGVLGQPGTGVLYGQEQVTSGLTSGARIEAGAFLDQENRFSLECIGIIFAPNTQTFRTASDPAGNPVLARPVFGTDLGRETSFLTASPNVFAGSINIQTTSQMGGVEFNGRWHGYSGERLHFDGLVGFRYLRLAERLQINESHSGLNGVPILFNGNGLNYDSLAVLDSFATTNNFFGTQFGGRLTWESDLVSLAAFAKLGLGATMEHVSINGSTTFMSAVNPTTTVNGGVLALPSNIGDHNRTVFGVLPEMGVNVGINLSEHVRLNMGYSTLLWRVARPGLQYDHNVNTSYAPSSQNYGITGGPAAPTFRSNDELFWSHNLTIGMEFHF